MGEFYSNIKEGRLQKNVSNQIANELKSLEGKRVEIKIKKVGATRSDRQNRYLHLLFTIFKDALNDLGNEFTMEQVKGICKAKFAMIDVINEETGECIGQRIRDTHEMSKTELNIFFEKIIRWAIDFFGIALPYPNENFELEFKD